MSKAGVSELFRTYHRELLKFATKLVGDRGVGEEIVQDTFLKLVGGRVEVATIDSPRNYLFTATRNLAFNSIARSRREWDVRVDAAELDHVLDSSSDPSVIHQHRQRLRQLAAALNELPENCRTAFFMHRMQGYAHHEIASQMGIPIGRIERMLTKAVLHCAMRLGAV